MRYTIFRHPQVEQDLFDIVDLIAEYAGIGVANRKLTEIETTLNNLSHTPHVGSTRDDIYPGLRAIPTARKGVIAFTIDTNEKSVFVVSITYVGADWIERTPKRTNQ